MLFNVADLKTELYSVKDAIGFQFSNDGRSLLGIQSSHHDGTIQINAMDRGKDAMKLVSTRIVRERKVTALSFTPDEKFILAGYVEDGEVRAFVSAKVSDTPLWTAKCTGGPVGKLRVSPDGKSVWACGWENCKICQIDLASGEVLASLAAQNSPARSLPDPSPNTAYLVGWNNKNSIAELWDLETKKVVAHFGGSSITTVCWHPDSRRVLWSDGFTLHLWDAVTHADVTTFDTGKSSIAVIAVSPDGKWAATGTADGEVRFWPMPVIRAGK
jgi:WD40 repeat protein